MGVRRADQPHMNPQQLNGESSSHTLASVNAEQPHMNPQEPEGPQPEVSGNHGAEVIRQGNCLFALKNGMSGLGIDIRAVVAFVALIVSPFLSVYVGWPIQRVVAVDLVIIYVFVLYRSRGFAKSKFSFYGYGTVFGFFILLAGWMLPQRSNNSPAVPIELSPESAKDPPISPRTGDATAKGDGSVANSGNGNVIVLNPQPPNINQKAEK